MFRKKILAIFLSIVLIVPIMSILFACKDKNAPKYLGFSALTELSSLQELTAYKKVSKVKTLTSEDENIVEDDENQDESEEQDDLIVHRPADCYTSPNQEFYLLIKLDNPNEYEILSITVNGIKYQSYQFNENSTSENILIKVKANEKPGIYDYILNSVKYINNDSVGSVSLLANKNESTISTSVRVGVKAKISITHPFSFVTIPLFVQYTTNEDIVNEGINITINDDNNAIENSNGYIEMRAYQLTEKGREQVFSFSLQVGENNIKLSDEQYNAYKRNKEDLSINYNPLILIITGTFDSYSEYTEHAYSFYENEFIAVETYSDIITQPVYHCLLYLE